MTVEQRRGIAVAAAQRWVESDGGALEYTGGASHELTGNAIGDEFYDFYRTPRRVHAGGPIRQPTLTSDMKFLKLLSVQRHRHDLAAPAAVPSPATGRTRRS
ncbi:hypothetical protein [Rhizobium sp. BK456]|uniref:hypothetical protein n=1 Tax=Rhizobium sp. BK456 TaxID=2587007 RepID=UPI001622CCB1|nr:hypothetical protein [Rhizobium sp. BK456]MBB3527591.1 hypothetical protein [Rhizobium sp. BK456]